MVNTNGKAGKQNNLYLPCMNEASFRQASWRRLKKNKGAMAGLVLIFLALITAAFSYLIAPDHSPYSNRIILEIGGEKPGYKKDFLLVKKTDPVTTGFLNAIFS